LNVVLLQFVSYDLAICTPHYGNPFAALLAGCQQP
jgi:hypothetical protein